MIFLKGLLAGAAALGIMAAVLFGLAVIVPRILDLLPLPTNEGGVFVYVFPKWWFVAVALLTFGGGFYRGYTRGLQTRGASGIK